MNYRLLSLLVFSAAAIAGPSPAAKAATPPLSGVELQRESLRKQRDSLRQQLGVKVEDSASDFQFLTPPTLMPENLCLPLNRSEVEPLIADAAKKQSLSVDLVRAVIRQESGFKPCAVSSKGAQGLMQLMPATAERLHVSDPFDPEENVQAGALFLKQLLKRYNGDLKLALVAYNAGSERADQPDPSQYPAETQGYLANIFSEVGKPQEAESVPPPPE